MNDNFIIYNLVKGVFINYVLGGAGKIEGGSNIFGVPHGGGVKNFWGYLMGGGQKFLDLVNSILYLLIQACLYWTPLQKPLSSRHFVILLL